MVEMTKSEANGRPTIVRTRSRWVNFVRNNALTLATIVGVLAGCLLGVLLKRAKGEWTKREIMYVSYPGELFLRMLKCLIVPLLVSSITSAIGALDMSLSKKIAARSIVYYFTTTVCAVVLGIILVITIQPGKWTASDTTSTKTASGRPMLTQDTLMDLVRNMFPPNIIQATTFQDRTVLMEPVNVTRNETLENGTVIVVPVNISTIPKEEWEFKHEFFQGTNVLGLVMFSVVLGAVIGKMGDKAKPLQDVFQTMSEAMMIITSWVIFLSPAGVFFLITAKVLDINDFIEMIGQLGVYFCTVLFGIFLHGFGTIAIIFWFCTRRLPYRYILQLSQPLATAFGTGSSSATMPITIGCLDNMGVDPRVTRFVIPVGATINMDGTALYEAVAALFIGQLRGADLTFGKIVGVSITATAASIGAAGIPQAGLITMIMVLETVGLPAEDVSLIFAVDWLLDRFRTTINVMCDSLGAIIIDHLSRKDLAGVPLPKTHEFADASELVELNSTEPK